MLDVIDVLAERYGWAYEAVWQLPFCETIPLVKRAKKGQLEHYSMLLAIVHNPHVKAGKMKELPQRLETGIKRIEHDQRKEKPQSDWLDKMQNISNAIKT